MVFSKYIKLLSTGNSNESGIHSAGFLCSKSQAVVNDCGVGGVDSVFP